MPFSLTASYRMQSRRHPEEGALRGVLIVDAANTLNSNSVNELLKNHRLWDGHSVVALTPAIIEGRSGIFRTDNDALYYRDNFVRIESTPSIATDLLDVTKLKSLYTSRLSLVEQIFTPESFDWLASKFSSIERTAIDEYMCHEAGHRFGYSVSDKYQAGFFRWGGKLRWPLVYAEEYRADVNSWEFALRYLEQSDAIRVVLYTIVHRFGLAAENMQLGRPGAGYIPFLHFINLLRSDFFRPVNHAGHCVLDIPSIHSDSVVASVGKIIQGVDLKINEREAVSPNNEDSAEAMLSYVYDRLSDSRMKESFARIFGRTP